MKSTMRRIRADKFKLDERVNRSINAGRIRTLNRTLDLDAIGVITASERKDGHIVVLDGQHRVVTLVEAGMGDYVVDCDLKQGLTLPEEAELFRKLNTQRNVNPVDDYLKGVTAGDSECVAIDAICERVGLRVALQKSDGVIACVQALRTTYRGGRGGRARASTNGHAGHPRELEAALQTIISAWGHTSEAVDGFVVAGVGRLFLTHGDVLDVPALVSKLAKFPGGPSALVGRAKGLRDLRGGNVSSSLGEIVLETYNRGRRDRLAPL